MRGVIGRTHPRELQGQVRSFRRVLSVISGGLGGLPPALMQFGGHEGPCAIATSRPALYRRPIKLFLKAFPTIDVIALQGSFLGHERREVLRAEWRALFHLGHYGEMTASEIVIRANLHKTKVSRAVAALERRRFWPREEVADDRWHETLRITPTGQAAYAELTGLAEAHNTRLLRGVPAAQREMLFTFLRKIAGL